MNLNHTLKYKDMKSLAKLRYLWFDGADGWDLYNLMDEIANNRHRYTDEDGNYYNREYRLSIIGYTKDGDDIFTKTCIEELQKQFPEYDPNDDMESEDPIVCPYDWMDPQDYVLTGRGPKEDAIKYVDTYRKLIARTLRERNEILDFYGYKTHRRSAVFGKHFEQRS